MPILQVSALNRTCPRSRLEDGYLTLRLTQFRVHFSSSSIARRLDSGALLFIEFVFSPDGQGYKKVKKSESQSEEDQRAGAESLQQLSDGCNRKRRKNMQKNDKEAGRGGGWRKIRNICKRDYRQFAFK